MSERLLITGTRAWPGTWEDIGVHMPESGDITIIHGACSRLDHRGVQVSADMLADYCARGLGFNIVSYPVDRVLDGLWPAAGPRRNARMLRLGKPDRGLAFGPLWKPDEVRRQRWKRTGTGGMVGLMLDAHLPVRWVAAPGAAPIELLSMPDAPI